MKRFYALLVLALVAVAPKVMAGGDEGYHRTYAGYSEVVVDWSKAADTNKSLYPFAQSFTLGHLGSTKLFSMLPLHIEYGINAQYTFGDSTSSLLGITNNYNASMLAVNIPIHASLKLSLGEIGIIPYAGINLRGNILGTQVTELKVGNTVTTTEVRLFDDSDDKGAAGDDAWERFQAGFSYGVSLYLGRLTVGVGVVSDLMPLVDYEDDNSANITFNTLYVGFAF